MNITCNVIQDLLPLYYDDVCSEDSRRLVETHIKSCDSCKAELEKMQADILGLSSSDMNNLDQARPLKTLSKKWKRDKRRSFLIGSMVASILASLSSLYAYNAAGSYVAEDGTLVEAFGFIPLAFLFAFIALILAATLGITALWKKLRSEL